MLKLLINLFFPEVCYACLRFLSDNENFICTHCRHHLPVTNFHFNNSNAVKKVLYGRAIIENGTALFRFEKQGLVQQLIHGLKYKGYQNIGFTLGNWLGAELKTVQAYKNIDLVIPVPLHKSKLKKRGYNQVSKFAQQIAQALNATYTDQVLLKTSQSASQVNKKRWARWNNTNTLFVLNNKTKIENKHILIVDDVITTGATLEACINVLQQANNVKISIATIAIA